MDVVCTVDEDPHATLHEIPTIAEHVFMQVNVLNHECWPYFGLNRMGNTVFSCCEAFFRTGADVIDYSEFKHRYIKPKAVAGLRKQKCRDIVGHYLDSSGIPMPGEWQIEAMESFLCWLHENGRLK